MEKKSQLGIFKLRNTESKYTFLPCHKKSFFISTLKNFLDFGPRTFNFFPPPSSKQTGFMTILSDELQEF